MVQSLAPPRSSVQLGVVQAGNPPLSSKVLVALASTALLAAGCAPASHASPAVYPNALAAFREVCVAPGSHAEILRLVRASRWDRLKDDQTPRMVRGNGMVQLKEVRRGRIAGAPVLIAVGELGGASFCRIYFHPVAPAAMTGLLEKETVLGAPLGQPDFNGPMTFPEGWTAVGWHAGSQASWRSVHYSYDADGQGSNAGWQGIEITRAL